VSKVGVGRSAIIDLNFKQKIRIKLIFRTHHINFFNLKAIFSLLPGVYTSQQRAFETLWPPQGFLSNDMSSNELMEG